MRIATTMLPALVAVALTTLTVHQGVANEPGDKVGKPDQAAMRAKMLKRIDTNGDGKLSPEELARARSEFAKRQGGAGKLENHRLEVVTFPQEVQAADSNMNKEALLYHPIKPPEGKIPLIVLLHGAGWNETERCFRLQGEPRRPVGDDPRQQQIRRQDPGSAQS